jgi:hypothetical protein
MTPPTFADITNTLSELSRLALQICHALEKKMKLRECLAKQPTIAKRKGGRVTIAG